jgi:hypothetical protein
VLAAPDAAFAPQSFLVFRPDTYRVTRTLRVSPRGDITRHHGIIAHGARVHPVIAWR